MIKEEKVKLSRTKNVDINTTNEELLNRSTLI